MKAKIKEWGPVENIGTPVPRTSNGAFGVRGLGEKVSRDPAGKHVWDTQGPAAYIEWIRNK